jgi:hypothetical protein
VFLFFLEEFTLELAVGMGRIGLANFSEHRKRSICDFAAGLNKFSRGFHRQWKPRTDVGTVRGSLETMPAGSG